MKGVNVEFVSKVKYFGINICDNLSDDSDIKARVRSIYCTANMLRARFFKCSLKVKNVLFRYFFSCTYGINRWCCYSTANLNHLRVAYNNAFHILHNLPRRIHTVLFKLWLQMAFQFFTL